MTSIEFNHNLIELESKLMRFALKLTTNREDALDLCQETLYRALAYRNKITHNNIQAWVFTIMKNTFINWYRRKIKYQTRFEDQDYILESFQEIRDEETHPLTAQYCRDIRDKIDNLEITSKRPFLMYINGYKYREIAQKLNIPLGTVKTRIFIGRQQLIQKLKEYHPRG